MAAQRLALIGATEGPWVSLKQIRHLTLKVVGLPEGEHLVVRFQPDAECKITGNGEFNFGRAEWARISSSIQCARLICTFYSRKAA